MLKLFNTLTKKLEEFKPLEDKKVRLYACGPTVYDYAHIGNFRTYVMTDFLVRALKHFDYDVCFVMNITDVGHLTSDSDTGEDKLEKGAVREGKSAWDIAKFYTDVFLADSKKLNLLEPDVRPRPTQEKYLQAQITFIEKLEKKGFTYKTSDGIYFDTSKFPTYGALTAQDRTELQEGARVEKNPEKRNPTDFALWKFSPKDAKRQMEWSSPWGVGFPGWHIECSAMSRAELGDQIDIHTGGTDLIPIHHTNEIAQSEALTGKAPFSRFWVHGQFIQVDGKKMSKSLGNFYNLSDLESKSFDPLSLRYLYMTTHYRQFLNFTWEGLTSTQQSLDQLRKQVTSIKKKSSRTALSKEKLETVEKLRRKFESALENDLNMPQALAVVWETIKSNIPNTDKLDLLYSFDTVLGLGLRNIGEQKESGDLPEELMQLALAREQFRKSENYKEADKLRVKIEELGYEIKDTGTTSKIVKKK